MLTNAAYKFIGHAEAGRGDYVQVAALYDSMVFRVGGSQGFASAERMNIGKSDRIGNCMLERSKYVSGVLKIDIRLAIAAMIFGKFHASGEDILKPKNKQCTANIEIIEEHLEYQLSLRMYREEKFSNSLNNASLVEEKTENFRSFPRTR